MGVSDGQSVNAAVTNAAFMDKNANTFTTGIVTLMAPTAVSGPYISDLQLTVNNISASAGVTTLAASGNSGINGAVVLAPSGGTVLDQLGQTIYIFSPTAVAAGVTSVAASGGAQITGDVVLAASGSIVLGESGQNIFVYAPPSGSAVNAISASGATPLTGTVTISGSGAAVVSQSGQNISVYAPISVTSFSASGQAALVGDVTISAGTNITLNQSGQNIQITATGGGGGGTPSQIIVDGASGTYYGSTNTAVFRWGNVREASGTDITFADSATNGASFTINTTGTYSITAGISTTSGSTIYAAVTVNGSALTTGVTAPLTYAQGVRGGIGRTPNGGYSSLSFTGYFTAGDVVRLQGNKVSAVNDASFNFEIVGPI